MTKEPCVAIIPARGTSRRFPGKNAALFHGKPLVVLAVETALSAGIFEKVYVSSEDTQILTLANNSGAATILRPQALSEPGVRVPAVCFHVLQELSFLPRSFCVLLPTSPLRTPQIIRAMGNSFFCHRAPCMMSFSVNFGRPLGGLHDGTALFSETGRFLETLEFYAMDPIPYFIPEAWSLDVNTPEDLKRAELFAGPGSLAPFQS